MFLRIKVHLILYCIIFIRVETVSFSNGEIIQFYEPSYCAIDEYFNVNQLKCVNCDSDKNLVPSPNGLWCVCNERSKIKKWNYATFPVCERCKENEIPTKDQLDCIPCPGRSPDNSTSCEEFQCPPNSIYGGYILHQVYGFGSCTLVKVCGKY